MKSITGELARCLDYVRLINQTLPIDPEADALVERFMRERSAKMTTKRKLLPRSR